MEAVSLISGAKCSAWKNDPLRIGCNFTTYLFFELPPAVFLNPVKRARLILFKMPMNVIEIPSAFWSNQYSVYPLLDFFSVYSGWYIPPRFDDSLRVDYEDQACISYTEIDITAIVAAWSQERMENKGLFLTGAPNGRQLMYASDQYETAGMRPRLRLTYEEISRPLSAAPCTVEINR